MNECEVINVIVFGNLDLRLADSNFLRTSTDCWLVRYLWQLSGFNRSYRGKVLSASVNQGKSLAGTPVLDLRAASRCLIMNSEPGKQAVPHCLLEPGEPTAVPEPLKGGNADFTSCLRI